MFEIEGSGNGWINVNCNRNDFLKKKTIFFVCQIKQYEKKEERKRREREREREREKPSG